MATDHVFEELTRLADTPQDRVTHAVFAKVRDAIQHIERDEPSRLEEAVELFNRRSEHWPASEKEVRRGPDAWNDAFFSGHSSSRYNILRSMMQPIYWKRRTHDVAFIEQHASDIKQVEHMSFPHKLSSKALKPWRGDGPWQHWKMLTICLGAASAKELGFSQLDQLEHIKLLVNPNVFPALAKFKNLDHVKRVELVMCEGASDVDDIDVFLKKMSKATWMKGLHTLHLSFKGRYAADAVLGGLSEAWELPQTLEVLRIRNVPEQESDAKSMAWITTLTHLRHIHGAGTHLQGSSCAMILDALPQLESMVWDAEVNQDVVNALLNFKGHLKAWGCYDRALSREDISNMIQAQAFTQLERLHVPVIALEHVQLIVDGHMPRLHELTYTFCENGVVEMLALHERTRGFSIK